MNLRSAGTAIGAMQVLLVGSIDQPLFADVVAHLHAAARVSPIHTLASLEHLDRALTPHLVLVLQQWPDEYPRPHILTLIDTYPLARLLVCYGPWCNSDGRTRHLWPLAVRVPVSVAAPRLLQEMDGLRHCKGPLPLTADRTETYLHQISVVP